MRATYIFNCFGSLMLYYSLANKKSFIDLYRKQLVIFSKEINAEFTLKCLEAESYSIMGNFNKTAIILEDILNNYETLSKNNKYNCARIYRTIGSHDKFIEIMQSLLHDNSKDPKVIIEDINSNMENQVDYIPSNENDYDNQYNDNTTLGDKEEEGNS